MSETSVYQALGLQMDCAAVNMLSLEDARRSIIDTIARTEGLIAGSHGFLRSFVGGAIRLVVLPEYFLTSFPLGESIQAWQAKACIEIDQYPGAAAAGGAVQRHLRRGRAGIPGELAG